MCLRQLEELLFSFHGFWRFSSCHPGCRKGLYPVSHLSGPAWISLGKSMQVVDSMMYTGITPFFLSTLCTIISSTLFNEFPWLQIVYFFLFCYPLRGERFQGNAESTNEKQKDVSQKWFFESVSCDVIDNFPQYRASLS